MKRVRVRRDHPYAPAWTLVMLLTALTVYLVTEGVASPVQQAVSAPAEQVSALAAVLAAVPPPLPLAFIGVDILLKSGYYRISS